jgi:ABC-type transport system involved in cytochrome c biogenesis ATPase subunit
VLQCGELCHGRRWGIAISRLLVSCRTCRLVPEPTARLPFARTAASSPIIGPRHVTSTSLLQCTYDMIVVATP